MFSFARVVRDVSSVQRTSTNRAPVSRGSMTCACIIELIDMCDMAMTARQGSCQDEANTVDTFVSRPPANVTINDRVHDLPVDNGAN